MKPFRGTIFVTCLLIILAFSGGFYTDTQAQEPTETLIYLPIVSKAQTPEWIGPDGGSITVVTADPSQALTMYAATNGGGVFKSLDGGLSWGAVNGGLNTWFITALAVDPLRPNVLFCAGYKDMLYRSENYGQSWQPVGSGLQAGLVVYSIAFDPANTNRIYLATRGVSNNGAPPWSGIIYRSQDGGASWENVLHDVGGSSQQDWAYSIAVDPARPWIVYAAFHEFGPYKSTNYGNGGSWAAINTGINDLSGRIIGIDPFSPDRLFFGVWHTDGAFRSTDGGASWSQINNGLVGTKVFTMDFDRKLNGKIYLGVFSQNIFDQGIKISTDWGDHWSSGGLNNFGIFSIFADRVESNKVFAGTLNGGLFRSLDGGMKWSLSQEGLRSSTVTGFAVRPGTGALYAASYGGGVDVSLDKGKTWQDFSTGLGDLHVNDMAADPANPSVLLALTDTSGLYRIDLSSGTSWIAWNSGLPAAAVYAPSFDAHNEVWENFIDPSQDEAAESPKMVLSSAPLLDIAYAPSDAKTAYMGTRYSGVYKTSDGGLHWYSAGLEGLSVGSLAVNPAIPGEVYAGMAYDGVVCSSTDGVRWDCKRLPGTVINALTWVGKNPGVLYAGTDLGLYRLDPEQEWVLAGFEGTAVTAAAAYPDSTQNILAGTSSGVYISQDGGFSWSPTLPELRLAVVRSIVFDPLTTHLKYFLTAGSGILMTSY